jgi:sterol desaturase/sphingolipid hydroxylase (fatty acid hydroxylase superfamily)
VDKSFLISLAVPVFFVLIFIELAYGLFRGKNNYRLNDAVTSIHLGLISRFPTLLGLGVGGAVFAFAASELNLRLLPEKSWLTFAIAFVLYDFCYYWMHRLHHEYKFLWATHVVHHHGEEFNLSTALRQTSTGWLWKWIFYLPMLIVGVPASIFVAVGGLNLLYQFWVHTEHVPKLGWYEKFFITPSNHRIHHAKNAEYIDANYGGVFIIWDRMFGTYIEERSDLKPVYGTVKPLRSWNPLWANVEVFVQMFRDSFYTKRWTDKLRVWTARTSWRPDDVAQRFPSTADQYDFYDKFDPEISGSSRAFVGFQAIGNSLIAMLVFFTIGDQLFHQTAIYGLLLIIGAIVLASVLKGSRLGLVAEVFRAAAVIYLCAFSAWLDPDFLVTRAFLWQALANLVFAALILVLGDGRSMVWRRLRPARTKT